MKSEADILTRQSRPQRNSKYKPTRRDWRFESGVFRHEDNEGTRSRSHWEGLDYKYYRDVPAEHAEHADGASRTYDRPSKAVAEGGKAATTALLEPREKGSRWKQMIVYGRTETGGAGEDGFEVVGLHVRFSYAGKLRGDSGVALETGSGDLGKGIGESGAPAEKPFTIALPVRRGLDVPSEPTVPIGQPSRFELIPREWVDETYHFDVVALQATLRPAEDGMVEDSGYYKWYSGAVSVDAMLPPGLIISAKEIMAFYPHHIAWEGVKSRLASAGFRGRDIVGMQAHFRGNPDCEMNASLKRIRPKATASFASKQSHPFRTSHVGPGRDVEKTMDGFTVPNFAELVQNLKHLPYGPDARSLTECLSWYLSIHNTFTPRLELNVLHAQALTRALRPPMLPSPTDNLDKLAVQEWRELTFEKRPLPEEQTEDDSIEPIEFEHHRRARLQLDLDDEEVSLSISVNLGRFLLYSSFVARNALWEGVKAGVEVLEERVAKKREEKANQETVALMHNSTRAERNEIRARKKGFSEQEEEDWVYGRR